MPRKPCQRWKLHESSTASEYLSRHHHEITTEVSCEHYAPNISLSLSSLVMGQQMSSCKQCSPEDRDHLLPLESFPDLASLPPELATQV